MMTIRKLFEDARQAEDDLHIALIQLGRAARVIVQKEVELDEEMVREWEADAKRMGRQYKAAMDNLKAKHGAIRKYAHKQAGGG